MTTKHQEGDENCRFALVTEELLERLLRERQILTGYRYHLEWGNPTPVEAMALKDRIYTPYAVTVDPYGTTLDSTSPDVL